MQLQRKPRQWTFKLPRLILPGLKMIIFNNNERAFLAAMLFIERVIPFDALPCRREGRWVLLT